MSPALAWLVRATLLKVTLVLPPSLPQTCTTVENRVLGRMETTCPDSTTAISRYNAILDRWETTLTPGQPRVITVPRAPWKRGQR